VTRAHAYGLLGTTDSDTVSSIPYTLPFTQWLVRSVGATTALAHNANNYSRTGPLWQYYFDKCKGRTCADVCELSVKGWLYGSVMWPEAYGACTACPRWCDL